MSAKVLKIVKNVAGRSLYIFYPYQVFYDYHFVDTGPGMHGWEYLKEGELCIAFFTWQKYEHPQCTRWTIVFFRGKFGFIMSDHLTSV